MPTSLPPRPTKKPHARNVLNFGIVILNDGFRYFLLLSVAVAILGCIALLSNPAIDPSSMVNVTVTGQF